MNKATRAQGIQHLKLINDQGLDRNESETLNLYLPVLAESVKRGKVPPVPEFRRRIGLGILERLPLEIYIPVLAEPFEPKDRFNIDISDTAIVKISCCGENFRQWMLPSAVSARPCYWLETHSLTQDANDEEILQDISREDVDTDIAAVHFLTSQQPKGEEGPLLNNGRANILYVPRKVEEQGKIRLVRRVVGVYWCGGGWDFRAGAIPFPLRWRAGGRVFFRNHLDTVSV